MDGPERKRQWVGWGEGWGRGEKSPLQTALNGSDRRWRGLINVLSRGARLGYFFLPFPLPLPSRGESGGLASEGVSLPFPLPFSFPLPRPLPFPLPLGGAPIWDVESRCHNQRAGTQNGLEGCGFVRNLPEGEVGHEGRERALGQKCPVLARRRCQGMGEVGDAKTQNPKQVSLNPKAQLPQITSPANPSLDTRTQTNQGGWLSFSL